MPTTAPVMLPPLREGERLTRDEFMRRWEAMPDLKFAELIDGVVYRASPVSNAHRSFHSLINAWLSFYAVKTLGCEGGLGGTWLMAEDGIPQPDADLRVLPRYGGQSHDKGDYPAGAPELVVEVSITTGVKDAGVKKRLYERSGVREYLIVRPQKQRIAWHRLVEAKFVELCADADGVWRSQVFPGLWLDPTALWGGDLAALAAVIEKGVATAAHAAFVNELGDRAKRHQ